MFHIFLTHSFNFLITVNTTTRDMIEGFLCHRYRSPLSICLRVPYLGHTVLLFSALWEISRLISMFKVHQSSLSPRVNKGPSFFTSGSICVLSKIILIRVKWNFKVVLICNYLAKKVK